MSLNNKMVQYSVWTNCNNNCDFCLRKERIFYSEDEQMKMLDAIQQNIKEIDWNDFNHGISLLGGELYNITNRNLQNKFLDTIEVIIEYILSKKNINPVFSSVTNGIYDPSFLCEVLDRIANTVGIDKVDLNFSYDLKYRYKNDKDRLLVEKNIKYIHQRYNYRVGIQMILTSYLINQIKNDIIDINDIALNKFKGNLFSLLYPHPINSGKILSDFFFSRSDLLWFLGYIRDVNYGIYLNFVNSTKNSGTYKYTGLKNRMNKKHLDITQQPVLSDGKEVLNKKCGHSILYQCYSDCDRCLLCDIMSFDSTITC